MKILTTKAFWADALERAINTAIQTVTAGSLVGATNIASIDWKTSLAAAGFAAAASLLTSVGSALGQPNSVSPASVVPPGL